MIKMLGLSPHRQPRQVNKLRRNIQNPPHLAKGPTVVIIVVLESFMPEICLVKEARVVYLIYTTIILL